MPKGRREILLKEIELNQKFDSESLESFVRAQSKESVRVTLKALVDNYPRTLNPERIARANAACSKYWKAIGMSDECREKVKEILVDPKFTKEHVNTAALRIAVVNPIVFNDYLKRNNMLTVDAADSKVADEEEMEE